MKNDKRSKHVQKEKLVQKDKSIQKDKPVQKDKQVKSQLKPTFYILLMAYLLVPIFTPNFYTIDSNAPKFLAIALLNLISFVVLLTDADFKRRTEIRTGFFRNFIGLAYTLFLVLSLLSFLQAINLSESVINLAKLFTICASTYVLYVIFSSNRGYLLHIAVALAFVLLFECFTVFYHILEYVNKNVSSIYDIKSVYSHKNILSAALFIKIPAAIYLMLFAKGIWKKLGYLAFLLGALAILFMSSRAFYIGLALLLVSLASYFILRHFLIRKNLSFKKILLFTGIFILAVVIFSLIQHYLYPTNTDTKEKFNTGLVERLSTIKADESSTNARLTTWKRSFRLIHENPVFGVGSGNWKINVLKYESPEADNYIISYKNHNDFIEVTAETGLPGGLVYLSIFILILLNFIRAALKRETDQEIVKHLFLPAFGILAYGVDAFFNFPNDRPEIQALFALYVAMGIAFSHNGFSNHAGTGYKSPFWQKFSKYAVPRFAAVVVCLLLGASALVLFMNEKSFHFQRYVIEDLKRNKYSHPSSFFIQGFPSIPDLSCDGAPIKSYLARYLINENRSDEAIKLLLDDKSSPFDSRREYYLSMAYDKMGITDSVIYWGQKACELKPLHANMVFVLSSRLYTAGRKQEAVQAMDRYLSKVKDNPEAWLMAANQNMKMGDHTKALHQMDTAIRYLPKNKDIKSLRKSLLKTAYIKPYESLFEQATQAFFAKRYPEALKLLNDFISKRPDYTEAYQNRALCLYYLKDYPKSLLDVQKAFKKGDGDVAFLLNLRGVINIGLGKPDAACPDFKKAMDQGNTDGATNYRKFCKK